ncbi:hypothetical protein AB0898_01110, partial [Streptomyces sp. NPDC005435]
QAPAPSQLPPPHPPPQDEPPPQEEWPPHDEWPPPQEEWPPWWPPEEPESLPATHQLVPPSDEEDEERYDERDPTLPRPLPSETLPRPRRARARARAAAVTTITSATNRTMPNTMASSPFRSPEAAPRGRLATAPYGAVTGGCPARRTVKAELSNF